jgi:hypothetical protein
VPTAPQDPFGLLATLSDPAAAELCAALLRSEGIESHLRGESLGPYRLTIGAMAATQVWVPLTHLEEARCLIHQARLGEVDLPELEGYQVPGRPGAGWGGLATALAVLLAALAVWLVLTRLF